MSDVRTGVSQAGDLHGQVLEAIHGALASGGLASPSAPADSTSDMVLIGEGGLESLAFVTFVVALEEQLQVVGASVSVMDVVPGDGSACTADELAARIADVVGRHGR